MTSINREIHLKKIGWLFEKNDKNQYNRFDYKERHNGSLLYRIPEHQRYPTWNLEKKHLLIDSIIRNYPIHSIICSKHFIQNGTNITEHFDIEDGQTRLSILQQYYEGEFRAGESGLYFNDQPISNQRLFENYEIAIETMSITSTGENDVINEIFDRLQKGQPLKDCDKFWNWKLKPLVDYSIKFIESKKLHKYMGTKSFCSKKRERLSDIVGLFSLILHWNTDELEYINNSFKSHYKHIKKPINETHKLKINNFIDYYFNIIDECYILYPKQENEKNLKYYNICGDLGLILYDYFENTNINIGFRKNMWKHYLIYSRKNKNFVSGKKELWNNVEGKPNWSQPKYLGHRCDRVFEFNKYRLEENESLKEFFKKNSITIDEMLL